MDIPSKEALPDSGNTDGLPETGSLAAAVRTQVFRSLFTGEGDTLRKSFRASDFQANGGTKTSLAFRSRPQRLLRIKEVCDVTGLAVSTLYRLLKHQQFPQQVQLGPNCVGWREEDIAAWCMTRKPRNRRPGA